MAQSGKVPIVLKSFCAFRGTAASILASFDVCGKKVITDQSWKCLNRYPDGSFTSSDYDDSSWTFGIESSDNNGGSSLGVHQEIDSNAKWLASPGEVGL